MCHQAKPLTDKRERKAGREVTLGFTSVRREALTPSFPAAPLPGLLTTAGEEAACQHHALQVPQGGSCHHPPSLRQARADDSLEPTRLSKHRCEAEAPGEMREGENTDRVLVR